jgi:hypothetical protein
MRRVIQAVLLIIVVVLSYLIYEGINKPIQFNAQKDARYKKVIASLIKIRDAENAFKTLTGRYTSNWDSLVLVLRTGSFPVVKKTGNVPDSLTEKQALKLGIVSRDTIRVSMIDSLFRTSSIDSLSIIPGTGGLKFDLQAGTIETSSSKLIVPVFEAKAENKLILIGLDEQERINLDADAKKMSKFTGLKVGSMNEVNTNGNWETL